jgi:hypothetical protein
VVLRSRRARSTHPAKAATLIAGTADRGTSAFPALGFWFIDGGGPELPEGTSDAEHTDVASISIDAISPKGEAFTIELEIGTPYEREPGGWACPVALTGLYDRLAEARGVDSFQALCMAISLAQDLLHGFRDKGGKLLMDAENFPLEAYGFGAATRRGP